MKARRRFWAVAHTHTRTLAHSAACFALILTLVTNSEALGGPVECCRGSEGFGRMSKSRRGRTIGGM
eukprot:11060908-Alexandrium_andersonii.AAC.1